MGVGVRGLGNHVGSACHIPRPSRCSEECLQPPAAARMAPVILCWFRTCEGGRTVKGPPIFVKCEQQLNPAQDMDMGGGSTPKKGGGSYLLLALTSYSVYLYLISLSAQESETDRETGGNMWNRGAPTLGVRCPFPSKRWTYTQQQQHDICTRSPRPHYPHVTGTTSW